MTKRESNDNTDLPITRGIDDLDLGERPMRRRSFWEQAAWLPLLVMLGMTFWMWRDPGSFGNQFALFFSLLTILISSIILLFVAGLAARSYRASGSLPVLMLGCGTLAIGLGSFIVFTPGGRDGANVGLTAYLASVLVAAMCNLFGAVFTLRPGVQPQPRSTTRSLILAYCAVAGVPLLAFLLARAHLTPVLFIRDGQSFNVTEAWENTISAAVVVFLIGALLLREASRRSRSAFFHFYSLSLALFAIGYTGINLLELSGGDSWLPRLALALGSVYLLAAVVAAARESGGWSIALQTALRDTRRRYDLLFNAAGDGVLIKEFDRARGGTGEIVAANPAICEMLGIRANGLVGRGFTELVDQRERDELSADGETLAASGSLLRERTLVTLDGRRLVTEINYRLFESDGKPMVMAIVRDVTERRRAEEALRESARSLRELNESLVAARNELEQRVEERTGELKATSVELRRRNDQLARMASELILAEQRERRRLAGLLHDHLQQLLVGAIFGLQVLSRKFSDAANNPVDRILELLDECLRSSRSLTVELSPPILHEAGFAAGLQWLARWMQEKHGLVVELQIDPKAETRREDVSILLFQSVRELLFNIVKHAGVSKARVELGLDENDFLKLAVIDEGRGFDPAQVWSGEGAALTGFGLLSIRERLGLLGGRMEVKSAPRAGTQFTLIAPAHHEAKVVAAAPQDSQTAAEAEDATADSAAITRVLLVDDHVVMRQGLSLLLDDEPGIRIVGEASDGVEAVSQARALQPDVILMDFSMPRMDGVEATRQIHSENPAIRIIGLSMYDEADRAEAMRAAGAVAYVRKSGDPDELISAIRASAG